MLRISGLVRLADGLRRAVAGPMSAGDVARWRKAAGEAVAMVESLAARHGGLGQLPGPSRRAYEFLKSVDWSRVVVDEAAEGPRRGGLSWPGLMGYIESMAERLGKARTPAEIEQAQRSIVTTSRRMEEDVERQSLSPEQITPQSRAGRGWLAFLADRENLDAYLAARDRAAPIMESFTRAAGWALPVTMHFRPMGHLFRGRPRTRDILVVAQTPMVALDEAGFRAMGRQLFERDRSAQPAVQEAMLSEGFQELHAELESLGGIVEQTRGAFYDLAAAFDRVSARYFCGAMARPRLTWSRSFTGSVFGHYDHVRDVVMVSSTLDRAGVPEFVLDFVMYHELLHKQLGIRWSRGRRYAHTAEFREAERRFERQAEAEAVMERLGRGG